MSNARADGRQRYADPLGAVFGPPAASHDRQTPHTTRERHCGSVVNGSGGDGSGGDGSGGDGSADDEQEGESESETEEED